MCNKAGLFPRRKIVLAEVLAAQGQLVMNERGQYLAGPSDILHPTGEVRLAYGPTLDHLSSIGPYYCHFLPSNWPKCHIVPSKSY